MAPRSGAVVIPAPSMGWNTKDPISQMGALYAVEMENFFPAFGTVDLVNGYRYHSKSIGSGAVIGLGQFSYEGTTKLVAFGSDKKVYNATTAASAATDITGAFVTTANFKYMQMFKNLIFLTTGDGGDALYSWDGAAASISDVPYGLTGIGPMASYKGRWYGCYVKANNQARVAYSLFNSSTVIDNDFDFQSFLGLGGIVRFVGSVTRAKDFSEDELFCVISDKGEILVYEGNYPADPNWRIIGHYTIPRPLGPKAFFYIGANLCILTSQGIIPMSEIMGGTATGRYLGLSDNITSAFTTAATTTLFNDNAWCGVNYPRGNFAVCNIPVTTGATSSQFYMNTTTQAWCKRTGQNAFCWTIYNDELYFGGLSGRVFKADNGYFDENPASEGAILTRTIKLRHAFNYLGNNIANKQFTQAIPTIYQSEGLALTLDCDVDYTDVTATSAETDTTDTAYKLYQPRMGLINQVEGSAVSIRIDGTVTTKRMSLQATKVFWNEGSTA